MPFGDAALLVTLGAEVTATNNQQVYDLFRQLRQREDLGILSLIPAYNSLTVRFDQQSTDFQQLTDLIAGLITKLTLTESVAGKRISIPVCYDPSFGLDLAELSPAIGVSVPDVVKLHTATNFRVYMTGFLPGFVYLGGLPAALHCRRRETPRSKVPVGAVGLAGNQTGIYPQESPGGWQIIGQTPLPLFDLTNADPFWIQVGDQVRFRSVSPREFAMIQQQLVQTKFCWKDWVV